MTRLGLFVILLQALCLYAAPKVLIVGVSNYASLRGVPPAPSARVDAAEFSRAWREKRKQMAAPYTDASSSAIYNLIHQAVSGVDDVVLFLSLRGTATGGKAYLLAADSVSERPEGTQIDLDRLLNEFGNSSAPSIILFGDLCHAASDSENGVNNFLVQKTFESSRQFKKYRIAGILAGCSPYPGDQTPNGTGAFAGALIKALSDSQVRVADLFQRVDEARRAFKTLKPPRPIGDPNRFMARSWQPPQKLLALLGPPGPGLLAGEDQEPQEEIAPEQVPVLGAFRDAIRSRDLDGQDGILAQYPAALAALTSESRRRWMAVELEGAAQRTFIRYAEGDHFPDDKQTPPAAPKDWTNPGDPKNFQRAAKLFALARDVRKSLIGPNEAYFQSLLEVREVFCESYALVLEAQLHPDDPNHAVLFSEALKKLRQIDTSRWIAESYNAEGIIYLEQPALAGGGIPFQSAIVSFQKALQHAPDWAYARHNLALTYIESGDYADAEREYREAIRRTPYHPYLHYNLGFLLQRVNRMKPARAEYNEAIEQFRFQQGAYAVRSKEWVAAGGAEEAAIAEAAIPILIRNESEVYNALGAWWQAKGNFTKSSDSYMASLQLKPDRNVANYNLASLFLDARDPEGSRLREAIRLLENAIRDDSSLLVARIKLARSYRRAGGPANLKKSITEFEAVLKEMRSSQPPDLRLSLLETRGDLALEEGQPQQACAEYRDALPWANDRPSRRELNRKVRSACP